MYFCNSFLNQAGWESKKTFKVLGPSPESKANSETVRKLWKIGYGQSFLLKYCQIWPHTFYCLTNMFFRWLGHKVASFLFTRVFYDLTRSPCFWLHVTKNQTCLRFDVDNYLNLKCDVLSKLDHKCSSYRVHKQLLMKTTDNGWQTSCDQNGKRSLVLRCLKEGQTPNFIFSPLFQTNLVKRHETLN